MPGRYARLNRDYLLRGWTDRPLTVANTVLGHIRPLARSMFYVLESCDGRTNFDSLAFLPKHRACLDDFSADGVVEECSYGGDLDPAQRFRKAENPCLKGIDWCVTGRCNLRCRHCFMESPSGRYGQLPFDDMANLIDQFAAANVLQVAITGGEPFIRRDLVDIFALLAEKSIGLSQVYTNGLLITDAHLDAIHSMGFRPSFQISFDGVGSHDQMRGVDGVEERVVAAIRRVEEAGFSVVVSTCVDRLNVDRLEDTYELMKQLRIVSWRVSIPQKTGNWKDTETAVTLDEMAGASMLLLDRWTRDGRPFIVQLAGFYNGVPGPMSPEEERRRQPSFAPDDFDCLACREQPNLLPDGTLLPCPGYVGSNMQNRMPNLLREITLSEAWHDSLLRQIANMKKQDLLDRNPECSSCELFRQCGIGCRASALIETADFMARDPVACALWKKGYRRRFHQKRIALHLSQTFAIHNNRANNNDRSTRC